MRLDPAYEKALKSLEGQAPHAIASKSGVPYDDGKFRLVFFDRVFLIDYPEVAFQEEGMEREVSKWLQVLFLHYLAKSKGIPIADEWIAYRYLPGASLFEHKLVQLATAPLVQAFGNDIEPLRRAAESLGGIPMSRTGDAAYRFMALPKLPMACVYFQGEDAIPPTANILFDATAPFYLPTEDLQLVGGYLSRELIQRKGK